MIKWFFIFPALFFLFAQCRTPQLEKGVSAPFAGNIENTLIFTGGCNFPETPAAEGGQKRFYDDVFTLDGRNIGKLPHPLAYGVSVSYDASLICAGGTSAAGSSKSVFTLSINDGLIVIDTLKSLPVAMDNMSGAICQDKLYIVGGNQNGIPSNNVFSLDLTNSAAEWVEEASYPGNPRIQSVSVAQKRDGEEILFVFGGFAAASSRSEATLSLSSLCYTPSTGVWSEVATPVDSDSVAVSLGGGTGVAIGDSLILCAGGVNKDIFLAALRGEYGDDYLKHEPSWYRFNDKLMLYNTYRDSWSVYAAGAEYARAGAVLVKESDESLYLINGEIMPGIRTPDIQTIKLNKLTTNHAQKQ